MACIHWQRAVTYWFGFISLILIAGAVGARAAEADIVPRYKLHVGQELVYRSGTSTVTFYVTGSNPDGGWHVFQLLRYPVPAGGIQTSRNSVPVAMTPFLQCEFDITPDGRIALNRAVVPQPAAVFPPLPADASINDWQASGPQEEVLHFHLQPSTQPFIRNLIEEVNGPLLRTEGKHPTSAIVFDIEQGLPLRSQDYSQPGATRTRGRVFRELIANKLHPTEWAKQISDEASALLDAQSRYRDEMHSASETTDDLKYSRDCDAALEHLKQIRARLTVPELLEALDTDVAFHPRSVFFNRGPEALLGQPAPRWHFPDLHDKQHALADYRGKVVVMDFWYRNCPYCILEMPHLNKLAGRYAEKPVVFLGMNVDVDARDAQALVTQQGLTFPTLITKGLTRSEGPTTRPAAGPAMLAAYHIKGYPSLVVVGADGIVRQVVNFGDHFEEDLTKAIDSLLPPNH